MVIYWKIIEDIVISEESKGAVCKLPGESGHISLCSKTVRFVKREKLGSAGPSKAQTRAHLAAAQAHPFSSIPKTAAFGLMKTIRCLGLMCGPNASPSDQAQTQVQAAAHVSVFSDAVRFESCKLHPTSFLTAPLFAK